MLTARGGDKWDHWPPEVFLVGDLIHVHWKYLGVHGVCTSHDTFLLLEKMSYDDTEIWKVARIEDGKVVSFDEVSCWDYRDEDDGDWHEVTLISRPQQPVQPIESLDTMETGAGGSDNK